MFRSCQQGTFFLPKSLVSTGGSWLPSSTYSVDEVQLPGVVLKVLQGRGVGQVVKGEGELDDQVQNHHSLGAELICQNLERVADQETGPGDGVKDSKQPDEEDESHVGAGSAVLLVQAARQAPDDEGAEHASGGDEEDGATAKLVDQHSARNGDDDGKHRISGRELEMKKKRNRQQILFFFFPRPNGVLAQTYTQPGSGVADACVLVKNCAVVGDDGVSGPLREETERDQDHETVAVARRAEKVHVAAVLVCGHLHLDGLADLAELKLDGWVLCVAVGVVLGQDFESLVVPVVGNEETRGFGDP